MDIKKIFLIGYYPIKVKQRKLFDVKECDSIAPKDCPLQKYIENLRRIFDIMAGNVPQMQNIYEGINAFIYAITSASELLFENTLLNKEFQDMGIDFKRVLAEERERAIKRWID